MLMNKTGTHLYALYEGYNFNVANLYAIGFAAGAVASPFMGPLVDKFGRRNSALVYCALEMLINGLEQYKCITGLLISRMIGGITTNLLFTVFESWVVTEHRKRGYPEEKLELILRDSVIISNVLAIASGIFAEILAEKFGLTGPFKGAVCSTFFALLLVWFVWGENYGSENTADQNVNQIMKAAFRTIVSDSKICRIGVIQGLTEGALQTFIFLWCPALLFFSREVNDQSAEDKPFWLRLSDLAKASSGEPAFGFIFGGYMAAGAVGGFMFPVTRRAFRKAFAFLWTDETVEVQIRPDRLPRLLEDSTRVDASLVQSDTDDDPSENSSEYNYSASDGECFDEEAVSEKTYEAEILAALCYALCAILLAIPAVIGMNPQLLTHKFEVSLAAFVTYEILVGIYMPCEGVLRAKYMPNESICSVMTILRIIVNLAVAFGVYMTNVVPLTTAFGLCSGALTISCALQFSLVQMPALTTSKVEVNAVPGAMVRIELKKEQ
jgi:MFS family permease